MWKPALYRQDEIIIAGGCDLLNELRARDEIAQEPSAKTFQVGGKQRPPQGAFGHAGPQI